MSLINRRFLWALPALAVAGCMVGPDYHPTATTMPAHWAPTTAPTQPVTPTTRPADLAGWWKNFNDPTLDDLVNRAISGNLTVKQALSRIQQARAQKGVAQSAYYPDVNTGAGTGFANRSAGQPQVDRYYRANIDASWELDVFGGTGRAVEAADANILASQENLRDALVTLLGDVAANYVELRGLQQRIAYARQNLDLQEKTQKLVERQFVGGMASRLDLANAQSQTATTRSQIPLLEAAARTTIYRLSVLLGREPGELIALLEPTGPTPTVPEQVPMGLPADLLRRRPDIRSAEALVHAATANIGVATSDLYPKFFLTGTGGLSSGRLSQLGNTGFWSAGPSATWQLFSGGQVQSNIKIQEALRDQSVLTYQQTILNALSEVDSALVNFAREQERRQALAEAVTASMAAVDLSKKLWTEGQVDFLNVLSAQRTLLSAQDSYEQSNATVATDLIALYKALGGGWEGVSPTTQPTSQPANRAPVTQPTR